MHVITIDVETDGLGWDKPLIGGSIVSDSIRVSLPKDEFLSVVLALAADDRVYLNSHTNYDALTLRENGITVERRVDTQVMAKCYNPSLPSYNLDSLASKYTEYKKMEKPTEWGTWSTYMAEYCLMDSIAAHSLFKFFSSKPLGNYWSLEQPFHRVLDEIMWKGMPIDESRCLSVLEELKSSLEESYREIQNLVGLVPVSVDQTTNEPKVKTYTKPYKRNGVLYGDRCEIGELNPSSAPQTIWVYINRFGIKKSEFRTTEKGMLSVKDLPKDNPLSSLIAKYKSTKIGIDYIQGLLENSKGTGVVHSNFQQIGALTGRMSSSEPNLQNPASDERIRSVFSVTEEDKVFVGWDLSNIEGRLTAEYLYRFLGYRKLLDIFLSGVDFHTQNSQDWGLVEFFNGDTKKARFASKSIFACLYGGGPQAIADFIGAPLEIGEKVLSLIESNFPALNELKKLCWEKTEKSRGVLYTIFNRKLFYPEILASEKYRVGRAKRQAFNAWIQGAGADVIKLINVKLGQKGYYPNAIVHDENQTVLPVSEVENYKTALAEVFEDINSNYGLAVPITYDIRVGSNWSETH